ncbi:MAG: N-acetylneuraminate synthase [Gammaproteobacteria bacterium]|nr:N-acetylneuraminate synthase [Gammaproteobacteria bacterium]
MNDVLIIAEVGSVHDGSFGNALKLADLAQELGADVVKYQTHIAEAETLSNAPSPGYFSAESRFDYFNRTGFSLDQWKQIKNHCDSIGIEFASSPFSELAVDWLEEIGIDRYKVPSGEVTNLPLLAKLKSTGKPILLSSGMSNWEELDAAVNELDQTDLTVLQCTSMYPCPVQRVGLNVLDEMQDRYHCPIGFSDHTQTNYAAFSAVSKGARCIEKHLTFSNAMYGSDAPLASEPEDFRDMVKGVREISTMLATPVDKDNIEDFADMKFIFQKSIVAGTDLKRGETVTEAMLCYKKPGSGISAADFRNIIGARVAQDVPEGQLLSDADIEFGSSKN